MLDGAVWDLCSTKDRFTPIREGHIQVPLYTSPQAAQPLSDEQALAILRDTPQQDVTQPGWILRRRLAWVRAIEAAHNIKGTT